MVRRKVLLLNDKELLEFGVYKMQFFHSGLGLAGVFRGCSSKMFIEWPQ